MRFSCEIDTLKTAVNNAGKAVPSKSTIPAAEGVLIRAADNLTVCGTDTDFGITVDIPASVDVPGSSVLNYRLFAELLRRLPDEPLTFYTDDREVAHIECASNTAELVTQPAEDFPAMPSVESEYRIKINTDCLRRMITETVFATATNDARPIQTGVLFDIHDTSLNVVAADGFCLAVRKDEIFHQNETRDFRFVIPGDRLREIEKILAFEQDEETEIILSKKHAQFLAGRTKTVCRLLDGEFYKYENLISTTHPKQITIDLPRFINTVETVSLLINEKLKNSIRCRFDEGVARLSTTSSAGKIVSECGVEGNAGGLEIGLSSRYLLESLRSIQDQTAVIELNTPLSPCVIRPVEGDSFYLLIAPCQIRKSE